ASGFVSHIKMPNVIAEPRGPRLRCSDQHYSALALAPGSESYLQSSSYDRFRYFSATAQNDVEQLVQRPRGQSVISSDPSLRATSPKTKSVASISCPSRFARCSTLRSLRLRAAHSRASQPLKHPESHHRAHSR